MELLSELKLDTSELKLDRCPHCRFSHPLLAMMTQFSTSTHSEDNHRLWRCYRCSSCGGVVTAAAMKGDSDASVIEYYPQLQTADAAIPDRARDFLNQAIDSLHAPAGAVMLCASSVDAMLKEKNYKDGSLYQRIDKAAEDHLITTEMAAWAHEIRLDANDQRHADESAELPTQDEAKKCIDFTTALGEFLFVLPGRVARGRKATP